jgi:hypothetical protein
VTLFRQLLTRSVQQFSANAVILEIREYRKDLYLSGFTHAEAKPDYLLIDDANVTWQRARTNVFCPRLRCDPYGA